MRLPPGSGLLAGVLAVAVGLLAALALVVLADPGRPPARAAGATVSVVDAMGSGDTEGFARALRPRPLVFPADHGPHPAFRTEWWYWTGNLRAGDGRRFGFQLTFFRTALAPAAVPRSSAWATREAYTAHLAVTDVTGGRFRAAERWARPALGLAGATTEPPRVWLGDWLAEGRAPAGLPIHVRADAGAVAVDLVLAGGKAPVLHGERGLSRKSEEVGNASYYYSLTRMPAVGTVRVEGQTVAVEGFAWMDREWSTSALGPDLVGWDWFALQLDDGRELMVYRLRRADGSAAPASQGTLVAADGGTRGLDREAVEVETLGHWTSPRDGTRYPARWRLRVPSAALDLTVTPLLADQELDLTLRYWEGAVRVVGTADGRALGGAGYVELVGYHAAAGRSAEAVRQ